MSQPAVPVVMPSFAEAVVAWARQTPWWPANAEDAGFVEISRTDGWGSDSGTFWPAETTVVLTVYTRTVNGHRRGRRVEFPAPADIGDFLAEIFDALAAPSEGTDSGSAQES